MSDEGQEQLGPFMILEFIEGVSLATLLKQPTETEQDEVILATDVDNRKLDYVYEQLADYMLSFRVSTSPLSVRSRNGLQMNGPPAPDP